MTFINNTFDTVDDEELAVALATKSDKSQTYTKSQVNSNFQPTGNYATTTTLTLRLKQVVIENKTDPPKKEEPIETKKEVPPEPPKVKEPEPPKIEEPEPPKAKEPEPQIERNSFRFEGGNLMFYE